MVPEILRSSKGPWQSSRGLPVAPKVVLVLDEGLRPILDLWFCPEQNEVDWDKLRSLWLQIRVIPWFVSLWGRPGQLRMLVTVWASNLGHPRIFKPLKNAWSADSQPEIAGGQVEVVVASNQGHPLIFKPPKNVLMNAWKVLKVDLRSLEAVLNNLVLFLRSKRRFEARNTKFTFSPIFPSNAALRFEWDFSSWSLLQVEF